MGKSASPFEHHHPRDDGDAEPLDPAQESLADALRVSFFLLKIAMLVLLVFYLFSNVFNVSEQTVAVRLRFGHLVGDPGRPEEQVLRPGGPHFSFPYPIDQVIQVPTKIQTVSLIESFWFTLTDEEKDMSDEDLAKTKTDPLSPLRDSYLVSGDANVVHARWTISFQVGGDTASHRFAENVIKYVTHVGDDASAQKIVRSAAERGIVAFASQRPADELINGLNDGERALVKSTIQRALDELNCGLTITSVSMPTAAVPLPVRNAYDAVTRANAERKKNIEQAQKDRNNILNNAAGPAHAALWRLIRDYQTAHDEDDQNTVGQVNSQLTEAFEDLIVDDGDHAVEIGGEVASIINAARTYRTQIIKTIQAEANKFESLFNQYQENPSLMRRILSAETRARIMSGQVEPIFVPSNTSIVVQTNTNPEVRTRWSEEALSQEKDEQTDE